MPEGNSNGGAARLGYVLKRYPRLSETFIVNEILALERAGLGVRIYASARPSGLTTHAAVGRVRARVTYFRENSRRLWRRRPEKLRAECGAAELFDRLRVRFAGDEEQASELAQACSIAGMVRREGISHLHAHFATSAARIASLAARFAGVPYSFTAHAKDIFLESVDRDLLGRLLRGASFVVAISDYHARFLHDCEPHARVLVVRNGLDLKRLAWAGDERSARPGRILAIGRLIEKKGFEYLLSACDILRRQGIPFDCCLAGEGPLRPELERQIQRLQLESRVKLLGALSQEQVRVQLSEASVFAAPCVSTSSGDRDGLPTVILEAMALGVPVVSTPVTAIPEIVRHGDTGALVPECDSEQLAQAIRDLLERPSYGHKLAVAARRAVEKNHDADISAGLLMARFAPESSWA